LEMRALGIDSKGGGPARPLGNGEASGARTNGGRGKAGPGPRTKKGGASASRSGARQGRLKLIPDKPH
jgi:hypothetical protein